MVIHCQLKKMIQVKLKLGLPIACVHHGKRNQINTPRLILYELEGLFKKEIAFGAGSCGGFTCWNGKKNLHWLICITCTVVSIPSESGIARASKRSFGICTSCVPLATVASIFKALINVWNEINTTWRRDRLCLYWWGGLNVKIRNDNMTWWYSSFIVKGMILMLKGNLNSTKNY